MNDESPAEFHDAPPPVAEEDLKWPVGFLVILALAAVYVGWRIIQLLGRLFDFIA